jgi:hypothetical protein
MSQLLLDLFTAARELERVTGWAMPSGLSSLETKADLHREVIPCAQMGQAVLKSSGIRVSKTVTIFTKSHENTCQTGQGVV